MLNVEYRTSNQILIASTLFASLLKFVSYARQLFAADDLSRRHFQMLFFLGAIRVIHHRHIVDDTLTTSVRRFWSL